MLELLHSDILSKWHLPCGILFVDILTKVAPYTEFLALEHRCVGLFVYFAPTCRTIARESGGKTSHLDV